LEIQNLLYKINNGQSQNINLKIESDYKFETEKEVSTTSEISDFDVSPNGKLIALEINGEIFVKQNNKDRKNCNNVSNHAYRDRNPQWISDTEILFISDRDGHNEIYKAVSKDTLVGLALIFITMITMFLWVFYFYFKIF